jgi:hypothetical protein
MTAAEIATRPFWAARNWSADAGAGSIHDDATATRLGFRGGTVAGSVHMDQCASLLAEEYGKVWFERGALSLYFRNATTDGERVQAQCEVPHDGRQVAVWVRREDGLEVAEGTASVGDHDASALRVRDLRPLPPERLRILSRLAPGQRLGEWHHTLEGVLQRARYAQGAISDPLSWYDESSPWGAPVAAPSTAVEMLWGVPMAALRNTLGEAVGLFGAIEVAHHNGPLLIGERYRVTAQVVALSDSPRTESLWFDAQAFADGELIAGQRMMLRFMKASSPLYPELDPANSV